MTVIDKRQTRTLHYSPVTYRDSATMQGLQECVLDGLPAQETSPHSDTKPNISSLDRPMVESKVALAKADKPPPRNRRKSRWKLKFHHQALPPEYLKHYKQQEKKRRQSETKRVGQVKAKCKKSARRNTDDVTVLGEAESSDTAKDDVIPEEGVAREDGVRKRLSKTLEEASPEEGSSVKFSLRCKPREELLGPNISQLNIDIAQNKAFLTNLLTNQIEINRVEQVQAQTKFNSYTHKPRVPRQEERQKKQSIPSSGKIMNYSDLPYMGEITLDGIKPRRGRKPKKADICHLIYKNYGQVFPGAPNVSTERSEVKRKPLGLPQLPKHLHSSLLTKVSSPLLDRQVESPLPSVSGLINHTEVQNRIINSLLERRLTQEMRLKTEPGTSTGTGSKPSSEEPLNLCMRDLQSLKIKLSRKHGNYYETKNRDEEVEIKVECEDVKKELETADTEGETSEEDEDIAPFNLVTTELRESSDEDEFLNFNDQITLTRVKNPTKGLEERLTQRDLSSHESASSEVAPPLMPWPPSNYFLHPSPLLYYDRPLPEPGLSPFLPPSPLTHEGRPLKPSKSKSGIKKIAPKVINNTAQVIAKRKRSAIFIPPVPAENTANPTTEVSICKFKFTGGAKPSLQEKKMLSVDSGGNFRYYSGTGDKSMRGYEYFPRESLQQCQENTGCSPSGVFLTASALGSGEKIPEDIGHQGFFDADFPIQLAPKPNEPKLSPKAKQSRRPEKTLRDHLLDGRPELEDGTAVPYDDRSSENSAEAFDLQSMMQRRYREQLQVEDSEDTASSRKRSRKSRKSLAREKLEQTFKEKGFLIQTQQLESAEGATYCKFRQLRKFTRYLFRSWKDYLPGNVRDLSVDAGVERDDMPSIPGLPALLDLPPMNVEEKPLC